MKHIALTAICVLLTGISMLRLSGGLSLPAARWDEQTNIRVVRETARRPLSPVLYDRQGPFFEKPPVWYLTGALVVRVYDALPLALRLISVFAGAGVIAVTVYTAWLLGGKIAGCISWIMLLLSHQLYVSGVAGLFTTHTFSSADPDALQMLFMDLSFLFFVKRRTVLAGLCTGLAILTKGPLGFVPFLAWIIYYIVTRQYRKSAIAMAVTAAVIIPWYSYMMFSFGQAFVHEHILYHLATRATVAIEGHNTPWWFYVSILPDPAIYPVFAVSAVSVAVSLWKPRAFSPPVVLSSVTALVLIVVPTITKTRLSWYILASYPFLAITTGVVISALRRLIVRL